MCGLTVTFYDPSVVTQANIARQTFFETQVGMNKAEAICWTANCLHGKNWQSVGKCFELSDFYKFDIIITLWINHLFATTSITMRKTERNAYG